MRALLGREEELGKRCNHYGKSEGEMQPRGKKCIVLHFFFLGPISLWGAF